MKNEAKSKNSTLILFGSILTFFYFLSIVILSKFSFDSIIIGVFRELLTIPLLLLLFVLLLLSIRGLIKNKFKVKSNYFVSFISTITTSLMLILVTITE